MAEIVVLGASVQNDNGVPLVQALLPVGNSVDDVEPFGEVDIFQSLGVSSLPWPADETGHAEGLLLRNVGNRNAVLVGGRDTRTAKAIGKLHPGDTVLHSTGPNQAAQVQCKEDKRQVVLYTVDNSEEGVVVMVDGKNDKVQILGFGMVWEMSKEHGFTMSNGEASFLLQGNKLYFNGEISLPGMLPGMCLMQGPATGSPGGAASVPLLPVQGVGK